jgi:DNA-binding HxlR family transcriptional regulator
VEQLLVDKSKTCRDDPTSDAHVREVMRRVGDKWSLLVVSALGDGPLRFTELLRAVPGISHRMLTQTVRGMERDGLVIRESFAEVPPRVEYSLSDFGSTLMEPVVQLALWAYDNQERIEENRAVFDATH